MRVEFRQGIPGECFEWLLENVGPGNVNRSAVTGRFLFDPSRYTEEDAWFYSYDYRASQPDSERENIVSFITVKNAKMATWFALRWS